MRHKGPVRTVRPTLPHGKPPQASNRFLAPIARRVIPSAGDGHGLSPRPIETTFANPPGPNANTVPDRIEAQLVFNGAAGPTVVYATNTLRQNDSLRFTLQADARGLATGLYGYRVRLVAHYGTQTTTREFDGTTAVVNRQTSEFGPGWSLAGLDRLLSIPGGTNATGVVTPAGQLLVLGTGGALFFERTGPTSFASPAGPLAFHSLIQDAGGGYALISPTGDRQVFNSAGQLTQLVDFKATPPPSPTRQACLRSSPIPLDAIRRSPTPRTS